MFDVTLRRADPEALPRVAAALFLVGGFGTILVLAWVFSRLVRYLVSWVLYLLAGGPAPDWRALEVMQVVEVEVVIEDPAVAPIDVVDAGREPDDVVGTEPPPPGPTLAEREALAGMGAMEQALRVPAFDTSTGVFALLGALSDDGGSFSDVLAGGDLQGIGMAIASGRGAGAGTGEISGLIGTRGSTVGSGGLGLRGSGISGGAGLGGLGTGAGSPGGLGSLSGGDVRTARGVSERLGPGETVSCVVRVSDAGMDARSCRANLRNDAEAAVKAAGAATGGWRVMLRGPDPEAEETPP